MTECAVCLDTVRDACRAPCQHVFCRPCILKVLRIRPPEWSGSCPLCRAHTSVYNLRDAGGSVLAEREAASLYGSIFIQGGMLGLASYHFDAPDDCYISYENAPPSWTLADGSPAPAKKSWTECSYDPESYTFRGVITWDPAFGGMNRWDYEIVFSEDLAGVVGGQVKMQFLDGRQSQEQKFEAPWDRGFDRALAYMRWTPPPTDIFGSVYVQGHAYAPMLEGVASYHFDSVDNCYISYSNAPDDWLLDDGTSPPLKKTFLNPTYDAGSRTFRGVIEWPTPFGGDARWEYEMSFAEDFSCIRGGQLHAYGQDGAEKEGTSFSDPMDRYGTGMSYVQKPGVLTSQARTMDRILAGADAELPGNTAECEVSADAD